MDEKQHPVWIMVMTDIILTISNDMYFVNGANQLVIQGVGYFDENDSYPNGVKILKEK
jgi:hypothetical protein